MNPAVVVALIQGFATLEPEFQQAIVDLIDKLKSKPAAMTAQDFLNQAQAIVAPPLAS